MASNTGGGANPSSGAADNFHSIIDLLLFHTLERQLYGRLIRNLCQEPDRVRMVMALWLWFESIGHHGFIKHVNSYNDELILGFMKEAERCVSVFMGRPRSAGAADGDEIPLTAWFIDEPIDLGFFDFNRVHVLNGVSRMYDQVCKVIFNDHLMLVISKDGNHPQHQQVLSSGFVIRPFGDGTNRHGAVLGQMAASLLRDAFAAGPPAASVLAVANPDNSSSRPFIPVAGPATVDGKSLFITFSKGQPFSKEEIIEFFDKRYGKCVDSVVIERPQGGTPPMYGRMAFVSTWMIGVVLNGQRAAKFTVKGKNIWARTYEPRQN